MLLIAGLKLCTVKISMSLVFEVKGEHLLLFAVIERKIKSVGEFSRISKRYNSIFFPPPPPKVVVIWR